MTKNEALYAWFNDFMDFYRASAVPDDVVFPYGTYEYVSGSWEDGVVSVTVNLWFYTDSEAIPDKKEMELSGKIGPGGVLVPCEGGYIWIMRGSPWCRSLAHADNSSIKRRYINIDLRFLTAA